MKHARTCVCSEAHVARAARRARTAAAARAGCSDAIDGWLGGFRPAIVATVLDVCIGMLTAALHAALIRIRVRVRRLAEAEAAPKRDGPGFAPHAPP